MWLLCGSGSAACLVCRPGGGASSGAWAWAGGAMAARTHACAVRRLLLLLLCM